MDKEILRKWLKSGFVEQGKLFPTEAGTPQGGIISPTLANRTLDGMQAALESQYGVKGNRKAGRNKVNLVRYADDFLITGSSKALLENEVKPWVQRFLATRGLELSEEKTRVTHVSEGFDFLGQHIRNFGGKIVIQPSKKNMQAVKAKIKAIFEEHKTVRQERLIAMLNPVIRGWANYHRTVSAAKAFDSIDSWLWLKEWQWAKRRHPNKSARWIKAKYFVITNTSRWVFSARYRDAAGQRKTMTIVKASHTRLRRHIKVIGESNPFDPRWAAYFQDRHDLKRYGRRVAF